MAAGRADRLRHPPAKANDYLYGRPIAEMDRVLGAFLGLVPSRGTPMTFIEPLESRIQFAGGTIDTSFGVNGTAHYDPKTPLTGDLVSNQSSFAQDTGGRIYIE